MKITILLLLTFSTPLFANRSPAVEPVTGISIEEYRETTPSPSSGFDFTNSEAFYEKAPTDTQLSTTTVLFLLFASALPFVVWFGVMNALPDGVPTSSESATRPALSVVPGESKKDDDHDHHYPKAS